MQPRMITAPEYAQAHNYHTNTLYQWLLRGQVPGAQRKPAGNRNGFVWLIPEDAVPVRFKPGRPRKENDEKPERMPYPIKPQPPKRVYTRREMALYIRKHACNKTYGEISKELGIPVAEIRRIYERLHRRYGI